MSMNLRIANEVKSVTGAYIINEERLNSLSAETFEKMRQKGYTR